MASTQQSAVDYIRNGAAGLVEGLQNLQLIKQTLRERRLFSDSEIDLIFNQDTARSDQVRQLLDAAASKGEDVCYELLQILDETRDQTFPMPVELHPELHQWISCFSFQHDPQIHSDDKADAGPCAQYQKHLKTRAMQILHEKWRQNMTLLKNKAKGESFNYISLVLETDVSALPHTKIKANKKTKGKAKAKAKKMKTYIPTDRKKLSPSYLLTSNEKKILLVGKAGTGKSTVVQEILRMWIEGEDSQVSYVFYFDEALMKLMSESAENDSLRGVFFNQYGMQVESSDIVWKDMEENSENVVIIFDGLTNIVSDSVIERIMEREVLNDAKIFITCRPEADDSGDLSDWASFKVEVQGFCETSIRAYFKSMFETNDDTSISVLNNVELFSLCHVPMYAFILAACIMLSPSEEVNHPCTVTEMYLRIIQDCLAQLLETMDSSDKHIKDSKSPIMSLASGSYQAILSKTVHLADVSLEDMVQYAYLTPVTFERASTSSQTAFVFQHNTMQEFWAALFLLMTPDKITQFLHQSQTEEGKNLKYVITFLCGLLSEKMEVYLKCLVTHDQVQSISAKYFEDIMNTFLYSEEEDEPDDPDVEPENVLYVCQCLYEYQDSDACLVFLQKVKNRLDLNDQPLNPHECCAVSYVIRQTTRQIVQLDLMNCTISELGIRLILGSVSNLKSLRLSSASVQRQIWRVALQEPSTDFDSLLRLFGFEMHLSVQQQSDCNMLQNTEAVLNKKRHKKIKLCLHLDIQQTAGTPLLKTICGSLHNIAAIRIISPDYPRRSFDVWKSEVDSFQMDLFLQGARHDMETGQTCVQYLLSVDRHFCSCSPYDQSNFIFTLYLRAKQMGVLAVLQPVFQAWPSYWVLDVSPKKMSFLMELLQFQKVKKPVELWMTNEEHDLRFFLKCLPYISQLRFSDYIHIQVDDTKAAIKLLVDLFIHASESGDDVTLKMLSTVCSYSTFPFAVNLEKNQSVFLLDLFSYIRNCEEKTGRSVLPTMLPIFHAVPDVWMFDFSEESVLLGQISIIPQVIKLQVMKKPIELSGWKDESDKLEVLLQCLPYMSHLSIRCTAQDLGSAVHFLSQLFIFASEHGEGETLSSVCSYSTFPFVDDAGETQSNFLLELYSYVKEYESQTGKSVLPALLPIYKSAPDVWAIDLSKRVTALLPQTIQFKAMKRPVDLWGWSKDTRDLDNFLQCLPFVSQLRLELLLWDENQSVRKAATEVILDLFICALENGDSTVQMLSSVCSYTTFPFSEDTGEIQSIFLLELHSHAREYESQTGRRILPTLLPIYRSAPAVWVLDLSKGVTSLLQQTMQHQAAKRPVELRGWTNNEKDLKCFQQCLPFVSQLRFSDMGLILNDDIKGAVKGLVDLFIFASELGDKTLNLLSSVCSYSTFPFADGAEEIQSIFLLELHGFVRDYESQTGKRILSALLPIYQSAPPVWLIGLSKGMTSFLHQTMQLQTVKRPVELRGWTADGSELRNILQCVPYMSELNCSDRFFQSVCEVLSIDKNWNPKDVTSLLRPLNFNVTLMEMLPRCICRAVGRVLNLANPKESLSLSLIPQSISGQGLDSLFSDMTRLRKLRMNEYATLKVSKMARRKRQRSVTIEEVSLVSTIQKATRRLTNKLISSLSLIMRVWTVRTLDLTEFCVDGHFLILLLGLNKPVSVRMSDENVHQLAEIVYEAQDDFLTQSFLEKVGGDLSTCSLPWDILHYLLQKSSTPLTLDPKKNAFGTLKIQDLLSFLHRIHFKGTESQFVRNALKEIYARRAGHLVTILLRTSDNWINLSEQELESYDCTALRFALHYSDDVRLDLSRTTIPKEETESVLKLLHRVSELRVDRNLLLNFLHTCLVSREPKRVTISLLMALRNKLDFSHSSTITLFRQEIKETLRLSVMDCRAISSAIQLSAQDTELLMLDCQASDDALLELFPALRYIRLSLGKRQLLQLMLLTQSVGERDSWSKAKALSRALGKEIDLSYTPLYFFTCVALGLVLQHSEDLTHLNLSHCQLTDSCLDLLLPHLHKVQLLDLSNNDITDAGAQRLQMILAREQTVHIFNNQITDLRLFMNRQSSPETYHNWPWTSYGCVDTEMKVSTGFAKRIATVAMFDPEIFFHDDKIIYRFDCEIAGEFQCKATGLIFGMRGRGCVEYKVVHWNMCYFSKNSYEPAGPLYNIQTSIGEMHLLHLPHCETEADVVGDISVAHIHEGTMELLTPVKRTSSHVTVHINGLSNFATVRKKGSMTRYVRGQVLLFLEPINRIEQRLWVFLLPRNVSATEIKKQHHEYTSIKTSSDCILRQKGKYCLSSSLKKYKVQPKTYSFHDATDPDYHSAFELFFSSEVSELRVRIHEKRNKLKTRWNRRVILNSNENHASTVKEEGGTYTKGNSLLTEQNWKSSLCDLLEELSKRDLKKLRFYMKDVTDFKPIPYGKLEKKDRQELVDLMVEAWGFQTSVQATDYFMKKLPRNDHAVTSILKPYQIQFGLIKESRVH